MYEREINRIIEASANNSLTFFVGAGVSALSDAPTWKGLIDSFCDEMGRKKQTSYTTDEYLRIPQEYYYSANQNKRKYYSVIKREICSKKLFPNSIHRAMFDLKPSSFITTNYDTLLEDSAAQFCQIFQVVVEDNEVAHIDGGRFILKMHGDLKHKNIVLKEEDYLNYSENFKLIETMVKSVFSTNTVVFVGYGINDYNIKLILNWTKELLKDNFRKPIFIYTGDEKLKSEELLYHQSRGLEVLEYYKFSDYAEATDFRTSIDVCLPRYKVVFDNILIGSNNIFKNKDSVQAFDTLYELLEPLNRANALRPEDIVRTLDFEVSVSAGVMQSQNRSNALKLFSDLVLMSDEERAKRGDDVLHKYNVIIRVLRKAMVQYLTINQSYYPLYKEDDMRSDACINFDYSHMLQYVKKSYKGIYQNYQKAFFLFKLFRYEEAFLLYSEIVKESFRDKNYLLFYFASLNYFNIRLLIKHINRFYGCYKNEIVEDIVVNDVDNLFDQLPSEFQNQFKSLRDVNTAMFLYQYSYNVLADSDKLQKNIENKTVELGTTSVDKIVNRLGSNLHFILKNGLVCDSYTEYKKAIKTLMSAILNKYSSQYQKTQTHLTLSFIENDNRITLNIIDFYCLIEYVEGKDIIAFLKKYDISEIDFDDMPMIERAISNIVTYFELLKAGRVPADLVILSHVENIFDSCLKLMQYMNISQLLVDKICKFLFNTDFRNILFDDKIMFLDHQLYQKGKYSPYTKKVVETTLLSYLDAHMLSLKNKTKFVKPLSHNDLNYYNLADYMSSPSGSYVSRGLSLRVAKIMDDNMSQLYYTVASYYYPHIPISQGRRFIKCLKGYLKEAFSFELCCVTLKLGVLVDSKLVEIIKSHLQSSINSAKQKKDSEKIVVFPQISPFKDLILVGRWCLLGWLPRKEFEAFVGVCNEFDFIFLLEKFNFTQFDPVWLFYLTADELKILAANNYVSSQIRRCVAEEIKGKTLCINDRKKYLNLLTEYFC